MTYQNQTENMKPFLFSLINNPADVEMAAFLLKNGFSIRDYFLYQEIAELLEHEWKNIHRITEKGF